MMFMKSHNALSRKPEGSCGNLTADPYRRMANLDFWCVFRSSVSQCLVDECVRMSMYQLTMIRSSLRALAWLCALLDSCVFPVSIVLLQHLFQVMNAQLMRHSSANSPKFVSSISTDFMLMFQLSGNYVCNLLYKSFLVWISHSFVNVS